MEERLQRGVRARERADREVAFDRELGHRRVRLIRCAREQLDGVVALDVDRHDARALLEHARGELTRLRGVHAHVMRVLVQEVADLVHVALRDHLTARDQQHLLGDRLHLVEHVRGEEDHGALLRARADLLEDDGARGGIGAGERLVEQEHVGIVDDRLGELGALAHAAAVATHAAIHGALEAEVGERFARALVGFALGVAAEPRERRDELERAEVVVERVGLGTEAHAREHLRVGERTLAADAHLAEARPQEARADAHERGLARAVRTEQAPDARIELERDVLERGDLAVPLARADRDDRGFAGGGSAPRSGADFFVAHAITSAVRRRCSESAIDPATNTASTGSACHQCSCDSVST